MATALGDITVLDFSRVLAGPLSTMLLGDLGATVIKVERPGAGDDTRHWGPPFDARGETTYFQAINRNKRSLVLDLADPADVERARELARSADVVVENFRPGLMDSLGLGYDALSAARPELVFCSITGFGSGGGAAMPGYDLLVQAVGGLMSITGPADGEPQKAGVALVDVLAGLFATIGILAALRHREATGEGQRVEVDLLSSLLAALVNQASAFTSGGVVPTRMGNAHPSLTPYEPLRCADGELVVAIGNDRQFGAFCAAIGLEPEPAWATNAGRVADRAALVARVEEVLGSANAAEWTDRLAAARVPCGQVNDVAGAFALAERIGLDPIVRIPTSDGGDVALPRNPIGLSATPPSYRLPPPALGELDLEDPA